MTLHAADPDQLSQDAPARTVVVVGGGLAGLVAARRVAQAGASVTLLEASDRLGGQVRAGRIGDAQVDVGAESLHTGAPGVAALVEELGLTGSQVEAGRSAALLACRRGLRPLPAGMTPTGPTRLWPVVRSGVLSVPGTVRAGLEPFLRRRPVEGDISVGALITGRLGREVADRLVDPLLGSLHAADIHRLSLQATAPQLVPLARDGRSLVLGRPRASGGRAPGFVTWPGGLTALTDALLAGVAVTVRTGTAVTVVAPRAGGGFVVTVADGTEVAADAAVLAVPAHVAAPLVRPFATAAADLLGQVRSASVATVLATYPRGALPVTTTGLLVPTSAQRTLRAATFLSAKWPHLAQREEVLVRLSAGHADSDVGAIPDDDLVTRLTSDLADLMGVAATPVRTVVERWPDALPQLEVGHVERIAAARADLDRFPGLALAGAAYDGLGLVACLRSGERAAAGVLAADGAPVTAGATVTTR